MALSVMTMALWGERRHNTYLLAGGKDVDSFS